MRGSDRQIFRNIAATTAAFQLEGGQYVLDVVATFGGGNVSLQRLGPDAGVAGAAGTFLDAITPVTANGITPIYTLIGGTYRIAITTATGVSVNIQRVPDVG